MSTLVAPIEAILFVAAEPVEIDRLASILGSEREDIEVALGELEQISQDRGIRLQRLADAVQLVSAPDHAAVVEKFLGVESTSKLSTPALETLAVIAYHQPVARARIEEIRGVGADRAIATLLSRGLIIEVGRAETVGRPILYGTSFAFLEQFGLASLGELPPVEASP